jgi:Spy/CpxP family protein refolding chaperone
MTRSRLGASALLAAVFVLGILVGGAATTLADRQAHKGRPQARAGDGRSGYLDRLTRELDLTAAQRDSVEAVLDRHQPAMDSIWRELRRSPEIAVEREAMRRDIRALLTPDQLEKYAAMLQRQETRRQNGDRPGEPQRRKPE